MGVDLGDRAVLGITALRNANEVVVWTRRTLGVALETNLCDGNTTYTRYTVTGTNTWAATGSVQVPGCPIVTHYDETYGRASFGRSGWRWLFVSCANVLLHSVVCVVCGWLRSVGGGVP